MASIPVNQDLDINQYLLVPNQHLACIDDLIYQTLTQQERILGCIIGKKHHKN